MIPTPHMTDASLEAYEEAPAQATALPACAMPARFFFAADASSSDEHVLARWWNHAGLDQLGELVPVLLTQSIELSKARLEMERTVAAADPGDSKKEDGTVEMAMHAVISAMADFQRTSSALIASFSSVYVRYLILSERLLNTEHSIALHRSIASGLSSGRNKLSERERADLVAPSPIAELHALRETLRGERNAALLTLSECLGETPDITLARLQGHVLPASMASTPELGSPVELPLRRADLVSLHHLMRSKEVPADRNDIEVRMARLAYEQGCLLARSSVDRALNRLSAAKSALIPARACAADADARARIAQHEMRKGDGGLDAVTYFHVTRFNKNDREIEIRGETYLALIQLFEALGGGWESEAFMSVELAAEDAA